MCLQSIENATYNMIYNNDDYNLQNYVKHIFSPLQSLTTILFLICFLCTISMETVASYKGTGSSNCGLCRDNSQIQYYSHKADFTLFSSHHRHSPHTFIFKFVISPPLQTLIHTRFSPFTHLFIPHSHLKVPVLSLSITSFKISEREQTKGK